MTARLMAGSFVPLCYDCIFRKLPALFAAGRFPRWISAELHNYHLNGNALKSLLAANGYLVSGLPADVNAEIANVYAERR